MILVLVEVTKKPLRHQRRIRPVGSHRQMLPFMSPLDQINAHMAPLLHHQQPFLWSKAIMARG